MVKGQRYLEHSTTEYFSVISDPTVLLAENISWLGYVWSSQPSVA